ncbi:unnamed protein product [Rotaria sp. Silwood2]|nr:unnamed protein product [Rotaria sp. Silwood2]CAF2786653.1 unnamed protein product [Rotaria sp. Silwood2]CAF3233656.1 unnamed protein product [Rotaria sp. Silwood2]CAF3975841.1 unnamed protein product [Rotaria sp. Silwood2]CAF4511637.1 unnamed protein product [Rotaria sp. Silwood2]
MSTRIWQDFFVCEHENELLAITKENNTCKKRTEQFNYGLCHTYICAEYRKYPLCKFQLKAKQSSDGTYQLYLSGSHDHQQRNTTTRLPSPIREVIIRLSDNGLVTSQINKVMKALHPDLSIDTKVMNVARVQRQKDSSSVKFIEDLQQWCLLRQNVPPPDKQHDIFIPYYVANDVNDLFICLTTRQLLSACKYSSVLAIDCTYKITTNELPLLVFGTSDYNRRFYPMGICLISTDESADTFRTLFRGIQQWASAVNNQAYTISHVLADGAPGLTTAMSEIPLARRLMCWFHMIQKCRQHAKLIKDKKKWLLVEQDIYSMQLIFDDQIFAIASRLMLLKWSADAELNDFRQYFEQEWILSLPYWYEGAACLAPSTNNGLESLNGRIKKDYTLRNRLPLSAFLKIAERMLIDWSKDSEEKPFQLHITYKDDLKLSAYTWLQQLDKTQILQMNANVYVIPSKNGNMSTTTWVQQFHAMTWNNYDELVNWLNSARLISCLRLLPPLFCTCRTGLKEYTCVHILGLLMLWGSQPMPQLIGKRKGKGRPKKVKLALSKD